MVPAKATFIVILLAVATIGTVAQREIPEFLHICDASAETRIFEECAIKSIHGLQPYLKTGVPEYNIPSLEPLVLKRLAFAPTSSLHLIANEILVHDSSNFRISKLKADVNNLYFHVDVSLPSLHVEGQYETSGKILLLPIRGSGPFTGNFTDCVGSCRIYGEKYTDANGLEKVRINDFTMKITVGKGSIYFDNLFGGEQVLGEVINSAINNNFELFMGEFLPLLETALSDAFKITSDNIVEQFTHEQLFPGA